MNTGNSDDLESPSQSFPTTSLSNVIFCAAVQYLTRFKLTQHVVQSLCGSWFLDKHVGGMQNCAQEV